MAFVTGKVYRGLTCLHFTYLKTQARASLMRLLSRFSRSTYAVVFAVTFQSVHVAIENANASLTNGGNYVIWSADLESPGDTGVNLTEWAEIMSL